MNWFSIILFCSSEEVCTSFSGKRENVSNFILTPVPTVRGTAFPWQQGLVTEVVLLCHTFMRRKKWIALASDLCSLVVCFCVLFSQSKTLLQGRSMLDVNVTASLSVRIRLGKQAVQDQTGKNEKCHEMIFFKYKAAHCV